MNTHTWGTEVLVDSVGISQHLMLSLKFLNNIAADQFGSIWVICTMVWIGQYCEQLTYFAQNLVVLIGGTLPGVPISSYGKYQGNGKEILTVYLFIYQLKTTSVFVLLCSATRWQSSREMTHLVGMFTSELISWLKNL